MVYPDNIFHDRIRYTKKSGVTIILGWNRGDVKADGGEVRPGSSGAMGQGGMMNVATVYGGWYGGTNTLHVDSVTRKFPGG